MGSSMMISISQKGALTCALAGLLLQHASAAYGGGDMLVNGKGLCAGDHAEDSIKVTVVFDGKAEELVVYDVNEDMEFSDLKNKIFEARGIPPELQSRSTFAYKGTDVDEDDECLYALFSLTPGPNVYEDGDLVLTVPEPPRFRLKVETDFYVSVPAVPTVADVNKAIHAYFLMRLTNNLLGESGVVRQDFVVATSATQVIVKCSKPSECPTGERLLHVASSVNGDCEGMPFFSVYGICKGMPAAEVEGLILNTVKGIPLFDYYTYGSYPCLTDRTLRENCLGDDDIILMVPARRRRRLQDRLREGEEI